MLHRREGSIRSSSSSSREHGLAGEGGEGEQRVVAIIRRRRRRRAIALLLSVAWWIIISSTNDYSVIFPFATRSSSSSSSPVARTSPWSGAHADGGDDAEEMPIIRGGGRGGDLAAIASEIAARWNLTSPDSSRLLELQYRRRIDDYDIHTDFLHFHHIAKTGGTSISDLMNATIGRLVVAEEDDGERRGGILPGSRRSGEFQRGELVASSFDVRRTSSSGDDEGDAVVLLPYLASYAHTRLRPVHGPDKTDLASFFDQYFARPDVVPRRLRSLAMIREPTNLRASTYAMAMCSLNGRVIRHNLERKRAGLDMACDAESGLNVSALWDDVVESAMKKCPNGTSTIIPNSTRSDRYDRFLCRRGRSAMDFCRSPSNLLSSAQYGMGMRNMYRGLMGRFTSRERMFSPVLHSISDPAVVDAVVAAEAAREHPPRRTEVRFTGYSSEEVERYTLIDLGGLVSIVHGPQNVTLGGRATAHDATNDDDGHSEPDFLWFGITERMEESICLFYYALGVMPLKKTPRARIMDCPPTSWWTEENREEVRRKEPGDYAVWRAANAILDVRTMKMRAEVRERMKNGEGLTRGERDRYRALAEVGCLG